MIKTSKIIMTSLMLITLLFASICPAFADSNSKICDNANILTNDDIESLNEQINSAVKDTNWDIRVYTNKEDISADDMRDFCNNYYMKNNYGIDDKKSGVMLTIDMASRQMYVLTKGYAQEYFDDSRVGNIIADVKSSLSDGNYSMAIEDFVTDVQNYYVDGKAGGDFSNAESVEKQNNKALYVLKHYSLIILGIALVITIIVVLCIYFKYKNNGKKGTYNLNENSHSDFKNSQDIFINSTISVTKRASDNDSSDSSSGDSSCGGGGSSF